MKSVLIIFLILIQPALSSAHPGKTDRYGGHKCLRGCEEWGLFYQEYHLHDKDGRPLRVKLNKKVKGPDAAELVRPEREQTEALVPAETPKTETITTNRFITNIYEENLFLSNPYLLALLLLLFLLLILQLNRKRKEH